MFFAFAHGLKYPVDDGAVDVSLALPEEAENGPAHGQPDGFGISVVEFEEHEHLARRELVGIQQQQQIVSFHSADAFQSVDAHISPHVPAVATTKLFRGSSLKKKKKSD